ncbi:MAG TPA: hypothetical protein VFU33_05380 [Gaiellaceae bacterium]|nr:hypothetical protein [Gaiellaceae bacterium]
MALPVSAGAIRKLLAEVAAAGRREDVLAVGGASELAPVLRQQLLRGRAEPGAVRLGDPENADVYVHVLAGAPRDEDVALLRRARRARVPGIAIAVGFADAPAIPYVLATDLISVGAAQAFPLEAIARAIAGRLGEHGAPLAARVPLLREAVSEQLVTSFARRNGIVAAAVWSRGADLPVLALNELRLVLRLAQAHGAAGDIGERLPELAATLCAGFGLRALARELLDLVPGAEWAVKGVVGYGGTLALGEAARMRFSLGPTQRPGGVLRAAP